MHMDTTRLKIDDYLIVIFPPVLNNEALFFTTVAQTKIKLTGRLRCRRTKKNSLILLETTRDGKKVNLEGKKTLGARGVQKCKAEAESTLKVQETWA